MKPATSKILRGIKEYALITLGIMIYAFTWTAVVIPADGVAGGVSGIALLVYYATGGAEGGIPIAYTYLTVNAILIGVAAVIIGVRFGAKTIYAIAAISISMALMQRFIPPGLLGLADDKLLSAILAGAASGVGLSICFMQGGSTGGTDILAMIINRYRNISYGKILMTCDFVIIGASLLVFKNIPTVIYGYVLVGVAGWMVDYVMAGNRQSSQIFVISTEYARIADRIAAEARRGVTIVDSMGWHSKKPGKMVMVVCRKNETSIMLRIVREVDPQAFITVGSVMGVYGLGFEPLRK